MIKALKHLIAKDFGIFPDYVYLTDQMKIIRRFSGILAICFFAYGCSSSGSPSKLSELAMNFNPSGAELAECGLVSQFEKGRSTSGSSSGGG